MKKIVSLVIALVFALTGIVALAGTASAHTGAVTGTAYCNDDGTWRIQWRFVTSNAPSNMDVDVKVIKNTAGKLVPGEGGGIPAGSQLILNAWKEHAANWPGVQTKKGNQQWFYETVSIPGNINSVETMVQYDFKGGPSGDPTNTVNKPNNCEKPVVKDATASVIVSLPNCFAGSRLTLLGENVAWSGTPAGTRGPGSYSVTATADAGHLFADGTKSKTFTGDLAGPDKGQECFVKPPDEVRHDTRQSCVGGVESRDGTEGYVWNGTAYVLSDNVVWGDWTHVRDLTNAEKTELKCVPPCDDECALPVMPNSHGNAVCTGANLEGVYGNITVPKGATCSLRNVYVNGSIRANGARNLFMYDVTVRGSVVAYRVSGDVYFGSSATCRYDPKVGGSISVRNSHNVRLCDTQVCHDVVLENNNGKISVRNTTAKRVIVRGNKRFVRDSGDATHKGLSVIRFVNTKAKTWVVKNNAPRKVTRR